MKIRWLGHACFLITTDNMQKILIDPYDNTVGYEPVDEYVDVVLLTHDHFDHSYIQGAHGDFQTLRTAGEYAIGDTEFTGITTYHDEDGGKQRGEVVTWTIRAGGLTLLHMGDVGCMPDGAYFAALPQPVDVLMLPVGGVYTVDAKGAFCIMERLHPNITIPMHYMTQNLTFTLNGVHEFVNLASDEYDISRLGSVEFEIAAGNLKKRSRIMIMEHSN